MILKSRTSSLSNHVLSFMKFFFFLLVSNLQILILMQLFIWMRSINLQILELIAMNPEVMKGLMAKKCSKLKKEGKLSEDKLEMVKAVSSNKLKNEDQVICD